MISVDEIRAICFARHHSKKLVLLALRVVTSRRALAWKDMGLPVTFGWGMCRIWHILIGLSGGVYA